MREAIEGGSDGVESFIEEFNDTYKLTDSQRKTILAFGKLRKGLEIAQEAIGSKAYTKEAAKNFIELAQIFEDISIKITFKRAGIGDIMIPDQDSNKEIHVKSKDYLVALLLRFAADVNTQLGKKFTPNEQGWATGYPQEIDVTFTSPSIQEREVMRLAPEPKEERDFRLNYKSLMENGLCETADFIREKYAEAVRCLKSAISKVKGVDKSKQELHTFMDPARLENLISIFKGEAQYWYVNISPNLSRLVNDSINFIDKYGFQRILGILQANYGEQITREDFQKFYDYLTEFEKINNYYAHHSLTWTGNIFLGSATLTWIQLLFQILVGIVLYINQIIIFVNIDRDIADTA